MKYAAVVAATVFLTIVPDSFAGKSKATIEIQNLSKYDIHHLYLSPSDQTEWGPDQLGKDVMEPKGSITLTDIDCDKYDIKVVDEDGDECVIEDEVLCKGDKVWEITNEELLSCEGFK
ncbi:MAG TPA: hypothetical protein VHL58_07175 [Thermoanaerobaculia bacterium]|nr:hypothetical protein [Thermoanaerobaculia bacterium]